MEEINKIQYPEIANELLSMGEADQAMRLKVIDNGGTIEDEEDDVLDKQNAKRLAEIIEEVGWPTISKVGLEGAKDAWLIAQHADHDVDFQERCLKLMREESKSEISLEWLAKLEDRVRVNSGRPQIYGTQFQDPEENGGKFIIKPTEYMEDVEVRRKEMGLPTIAEATEEMYEKYKVEKPVLEIGEIKEFIGFREIKEEDLHFIEELADLKKDLIIENLHNFFNSKKEGSGEELEILVKETVNDNKKRMYQLFLDFYNRYDWATCYGLVRVLEKLQK